MKRILGLLLCAAILCGVLGGCALQRGSADVKKEENKQDLPADENMAATGVVNLMNGVNSKRTGGEKLSAGGKNKMADFAVRLFQHSLQAEENTMISPVSVLYALAMVANGAKGETLSQMEEVFGLPVSQLNADLKAYKDALPEGEKYKLSIANSIWEEAHFSAVPEFLQTNADYYGADIYKAPFNQETLKRLNAWVEENTDGMIREILDEMPPDTMMYLVNAIAFDAEWEEIYKEGQIRDSVFTTENGNKQDAKLMYATEQLYLEDENATGFIKPYADSKYAFVALLPKEGLRVQDYVKGLTGEKLNTLLANPKQATVHTALPKFTSEYSLEMSSLLQMMGIKDAFNPNTADFSGMGSLKDGNLFISRVLHKTFIAVDERGTKAGAATVIETRNTSALIEESREVILDRPFVYMIVDLEENLPLFIGGLMDMAK